MELIRRLVSSLRSENESVPDMLPPINLGAGAQPVRIAEPPSVQANKSAAQALRPLSLSISEQRRVDDAQALLRSRLSNPGRARPTREHFEQYLYSKLVGYSREHFMVLYLSFQHELIDDEILFSGTIGQVPVYTREVIRHALLRNAAGVVVAHNHPSGRAQPSDADVECSALLKQALAVAGIEYVDNVIVASEGTYSHARQGTL